MPGKRGDGVVGGRIASAVRHVERAAVEHVFDGQVRVERGRVEADQHGQVVQLAGIADGAGHGAGWSVSGHLLRDMRPLPAAWLAVGYRVQGSCCLLFRCRTVGLAGYGNQETWPRRAV
ncbi:hypothetical protein AW168_07720 [Nocardia brasiliensis]|nr:hypothetical protein [Nocardia brasiliensis]OCF90746.1 hypothetical protein AW168_07720 [Nocardia brasiliensis]